MERGGGAATAHPALKIAVAKVCCVREATLGKAVKMRRELLAVDTKAARAHAAAHHQDKIVESERLATARATKLNGQEETDLTTTTQELHDTLGELGIGATRKVLSAQINKRTGFLGRQCPISAVPLECRAVKAVESKMAAVQARTTEHGARSHGSARLALSRYPVHTKSPST